MRLLAIEKREEWEEVDEEGKTKAGELSLSGFRFWRSETGYAVTPQVCKASAN
jgi:hypothetical protein